MLTAQHIEGFVNAFLKKNFDGSADTPECHREWWGMCTHPHKFVAIAAPRGHAKSTAITLSYTLAALCFRERRNVLIVSDTEGQAVLFVNAIKREFTENEEIKSFFKVKGLLKDSETEFIVEFDDGYKFRVFAKGSNQRLRGILWDGIRPDLIVCDDMENDDIVLNSDRREKFRVWFNGSLVPCRSKNGIIRFVGTILHMDAMLERLMPKARETDVERTALRDISSPKRFWYAAKYRANNEDFSEVLWPAYKDAAWLKSERASYIAQGLGEIYSREYLNVPVDESNAFFRKSDFCRLGRSDQEAKLHYYLSCDLAVTQKQRADYTALIVSGMDEHAKLHIKDVIKARMDSVEIIDTILALNKRYDFEFCVFEKGAITNSILPILNVRMVEDNNYISLHTINPSTDKTSRAQSIRARMRAGGVKFDMDADWYQDFEEELLYFPRTIHDDQVDALSLLGLALDKFVEAPTKEEMSEEEREDFMEENGFYNQGRNKTTGY